MTTCDSNQQNSWVTWKRVEDKEKQSRKTNKGLKLFRLLWRLESWTKPNEKVILPPPLTPFLPKSGIKPRKDQNAPLSQPWTGEREVRLKCYTAFLSKIVVFFVTRWNSFLAERLLIKLSLNGTGKDKLEPLEKTLLSLASFRAWFSFGKICNACFSFTRPSGFQRTNTRRVLCHTSVRLVTWRLVFPSWCWIVSRTVLSR